MLSLKTLREHKKLSQRRLADLADVSFRTLQLAEWGGQNTTLSTLEKILKGLGYPPHILRNQLERIFTSPPESIYCISERILQESDSWKIHLFDFVDRFCASREKQAYIALPPVADLSPKFKALLASTVEALCLKFELEIPAWCRSISSLSEPWFVSGIENLKPMALLESPGVFRKRNLFVLENFLERA